VLSKLFSGFVVVAPAAITATNAPAGGVGASAGAWDTAANRDAAIATINALVADVTALRQTVEKLTTLTK
jgi:hypothetical protein